MKKVAVIILNYKLLHDSLKCIESVKKSAYKNLDIYVIDNNSQDGSAESLSKISGIKFIQNGKNFGYTGGNNIGIKNALKSNTDYIFILNPDTLIDKNTIKNLVTESEDLNSDIAGPKILFPDKKTIWYAGGILNIENVLGSHRGVDERDNNQYDQSCETDFITGAAMFVKREVFEKIGFFDENYFLYLEDLDFCFRAKRVGFKLLYIPQALVYHKNARSTGLGSPMQDYYITRNRMLFAAKFLSIRTRFALLREVLANISIPARRKALIDFMIGNLGKGSM